MACVECKYRLGVGECGHPDKDYIFSIDECSMFEAKADNEIDALLDELLMMAQSVRNDWSDFDGRWLLGYITNWEDRITKLLNEKGVL